MSLCECRNCYGAVIEFHFLVNDALTLIYMCLKLAGWAILPNSQHSRAKVCKIIKQNFKCFMIYKLINYKLVD